MFLSGILPLSLHSFLEPSKKGGTVEGGTGTSFSKKGGTGEKGRDRGPDAVKNYIQISEITVLRAAGENFDFLGTTTAKILHKNIISISFRYFMFL